MIVHKLNVNHMLKDDSSQEQVKIIILNYYLIHVDKVKVNKNIATLIYCFTKIPFKFVKIQHTLTAGDIISNCVIGTT